MSDHPRTELYGIILSSAATVEERKLLRFNENGDLYKHVGFFMYAYAFAELGIDLLITHAMGISDPSIGSVVLDRVLPSAKIKKLKDLLIVKGWTIDPLLSKLLGHFAGTITSLRNNVAHSYLTFSEEDKSISFCDLSTFPHNEKLRISENEFFQRAEWCHVFVYDILEIDDLFRGNPKLVAGKKFFGLSDYRVTVTA